MDRLIHIKNKNILRIAGLMTGTSMDGLDICVADIEFYNESVKFEILANATIPFPSDLKSAIRNSLTGPTSLVCETNYNLGRFYAGVTKQFLDENKISAVDAIANHGQTIHHVSKESTLQIGEPSFLAETLDLPVISDFRARDISVGGTGAPLIPVVDKWLFGDDEKSVICLNIGGISNVTYLPPAKSNLEIIGFDTGPGMSLLDEMCIKLTESTFDEGGKLAEQGTVVKSLVNKWMSDSFITSSPPKSTGRDYFGNEWLNENIKNLNKYQVEDIFASLSLFTAHSIAVNCGLYMDIENVSKVVVSGGGVHNISIMKYLLKEFDPITVISSKQLGVDPDFKEALGFAMLGAAYLKEVPGNVPSVTGACREVILGKLTL